MTYFVTKISTSIERKRQSDSSPHQGTKRQKQTESLVKKSLLNLIRAKQVRYSLLAKHFANRSV